MAVFLLMVMMKDSVPSWIHHSRADRRPAECRWKFPPAVPAEHKFELALLVRDELKVACSQASVFGPCYLSIHPSVPPSIHPSIHPSIWSEEVGGMGS